MAQRRIFDVFALCLAGLTLDILAMGGLAWLILDAHSYAVLSFLVLGLLSAGIVAATATAVRLWVRRQARLTGTEAAQ